MTTPELDKTIDLQQYVRIVWRRRGIVLLCGLSAFCATLIGLTFVPEEYDSKAVLLIGDRKPLVRELEAVMGGGRQRQSGKFDQDRMSKLVGRIRSQPFLERVVRLLNMNQDPVILAQARKAVEKHPEITQDEMAVRILVRNLQSRIHFGAEGPEIYRVTVSDYSAQNAQTLARWITELFVDITIQNAIEYGETVHDFGSTQLRVYEERLRVSEDVLEHYEQSRINRSLAQTLVHDGNFAVAQNVHQRVKDGATTLRVRIKPLEAELRDVGMSADQSLLLADREIRLLSDGLTAALRDELTDWLASGANSVGSWPPQGTYGVLRRGLFREVELNVSAHYPEAVPEAIAAVSILVFSKIDLEAYTAAATFLVGSMDSFKRHAQSQPGGAIEFKRLTTEVETNRHLLQSFQAQIVATDVSRAIETTALGLQIEILDPAQLPLSPSRPARRKILVASLLLGPLLGVGFAFFSETLDPTLRSLDDFAKIVPEPLLGTVPLVDRLAPRRRWIRRHWIPATAAGLVILTGTFLGFQASLVESLVTKGRPVEVVSPEETFDANP